MAGREHRQDWVERLGALYTGVVADVLDRLGSRDQCLRPDVRPLQRGMRMAGFARTVQIDPVSEVPAEPYKGKIEAVDALGPGDVMVISTCEGSCWGELLSTAALYRDCRGIVIDGYTRDSQAIITMGFPVFCRGIHPTGSLGRLDATSHDVPIECGGVKIQPGDMVLADHDGVVIVPGQMAEQVLSLAEEKLQGENIVREKLAEGMSVSEAFRQHGIL